MSQATPDQVKAMLGAVHALAEAIRDLGSVPSGHLYARVCGHLSLEAYTTFIGVLKKAGQVEEKNHLLIWVGPPASEVKLVP